MKDNTMQNPSYQDDLTAINKKRQRSIIITFLVVLGLVLVPFLVEHRFYRNIMTLVFLFGAMAGAWNILGGYAGRFSLGNTAFFGTGAYCSTILFLRLDISPWLGMLAGVLISVCLAILLGIITLRLKGKFFALCTIAFVMIMEISAIHFRDLTGGSEGLFVPWEPSFKNMLFESDLTWAYIFLAFMLIVYFTCRWLESSPLGYKWSALRGNEEAAESLGVNTLAAKLSAFSISAVFTSIGGSLYAQYTMFIEPHYVFGQELSIKFALYAIIGGMGSALGPFIGAAIIAPLEILMRSAFPGLASGTSLAIYALLLILVVLFLPKGFVHGFSIIFKKLTNRFGRSAEQHRGGANA
jgi:branched-chain amino acid transport system permease protein